MELRMPFARSQQREKDYISFLLFLVLQIDERGFMHGRCSLEKLKKMSKDGAYIKLKHILTIKSNRESPHIYLEFQNGVWLR